MARSVIRVIKRSVMPGSRDAVEALFFHWLSGVSGRLVVCMPGDICTVPEERNKQRSHRYEYQEESSYF